jgi:hypothetical protein
VRGEWRGEEANDETVVEDRQRRGAVEGEREKRGVGGVDGGGKRRQLGRREEAAGGGLEG